MTDLDQADAAELAGIEYELAPVDMEVDLIMDRLRTTHAGGANFSPEAKAARAPLFERLTVLSDRYGKLRTRRAQLRRLFRAKAPEP